MIQFEQDQNFPELFGRVVAKQRDDYLTKEHGFHVFKLYKQRLFSTLYPLLLEMVNKMDLGSDECRVNHQRAIQLMMTLCSIVPISHLHDKLHELVPVAEQALQLESTSEHIRLTAL